MSNPFTSRVRLMAGGLVLMVAGSTALAQGVGNLGQLPYQVFHNSTNAWFVNDPISGGPLPVVLDPTGPVWHKDLAAPPGALIQGGTTYSLRELLVVAGNLPWTDYHEEIVTPPGWSWINPSLLVNGVVPSGYSVVNSGSTVDFYFDPIPVGSVVLISKQLVYSGPLPAQFSGIGINQYPTPEPGSLLLLVCGGLLAMKRRRAA